MLLLAFSGRPFFPILADDTGATLSLYIADMWLKWAERKYRELPEWLFTRSLLGIQWRAVCSWSCLEYDIIDHSRRGLVGRRRPGN